MTALSFSKKCFVACALSALACGCDFGTLDDLSQDEAVAASSESAAQALKLWRIYDKPDEEVKTGVADIAGVVERAGTRPYQATIDDLRKADLGVPTQTRDSAVAQGMLIITEMDCSLDQIARYVIAKNQTEIYPKTYDRYERTYQSNAQAFLDAPSGALIWKTSYAATAIGHSYDSILTGGARKITGVAPNGGTMLLGRTILDEPAKFKGGDDAEFNQDYQIEAYYEIAPTKVVHYYGLWREFRIGSLSSRDNLYINVVLGNLIDFDVRTSKVCRDKSVTPKLD